VPALVSDLKSEVALPPAVIVKAGAPLIAETSLLHACINQAPIMQAQVLVV
jgi:hypothetical protein